MIDAASVILYLLERGHAVRFQARGDSMHPVIREHDYVLIEPLRSPDEIERGMIVLMEADRGLTVHRVLRVDGESVVTRGDSAPADDPPIARARVRGVVVTVERDGVVRRVPSAWIARRLAEQHARARRLLRAWLKRQSSEPQA